MFYFVSRMFSCIFHFYMLTKCIEKFLSVLSLPYVCFNTSMRWFVPRKHVMSTVIVSIMCHGFTTDVALPQYYILQNYE